MISEIVKIDRFASKIADFIAQRIAKISSRRGLGAGGGEAGGLVILREV